MTMILLFLIIYKWKVYKKKSIDIPIIIQMLGKSSKINCQIKLKGVTTKKDKHKPNDQAAVDFGVVEYKKVTFVYAK